MANGSKEFLGQEGNARKLIAPEPDAKRLLNCCSTIVQSLFNYCICYVSGCYDLKPPLRSRC